MHRNKNHNL